MEIRRSEVHTVYSYFKVNGKTLTTNSTIQTSILLFWAKKVDISEWIHPSNIDSSNRGMIFSMLLNMEIEDISQDGLSSPADDMYKLWKE